MATVDDRLVAGLLDQLISGEPAGLPAALKFKGIQVPGFSSMGAQVRSQAKMAMSGADPVARSVGRMLFATDAGPSLLGPQRKSLDMSVRLLTGPQRRGVRSPDPLEQMRRDANRNFGRQRALKRVALFEQEAARRSDITRRIMKIMKTQPGLGLLLLMGLGIPALIGSGGDE